MQTRSTSPAFFRVGRSPLVGRSQELLSLGQQLSEARTGRPHGATVVLLAGAPGIGKTRLLEEFPPPTLAAGVTVLRGGASLAEGMPPYLPFLQALGEYIDIVPTEQLKSDVGAHAATLAPLLPEIASRLGAIPPQYSLGPQQERYRLYEAVVAFLASGRSTMGRCSYL
jgi:predicted ATPase